MSNLLKTLSPPSLVISGMGKANIDTSKAELGAGSGKYTL